MALIKKIYTAIIPFPANYGKEGDFLFLDINLVWLSGKIFGLFYLTFSHIFSIIKVRSYNCFKLKHIK